MVIAVTIHEYVKAAASWKLGDNNPKITGRLTFNPLRHMDAFGSVCIALFGYGWGKPVDTSPMFYKDRRKATLIVYILPSAVNLLFGMMMGFAAFFIHSGLDGVETAQAVLGAVHGVVYQLAFVNVAMALFNVIPIYPLDGAKVLSLFLSAETRVKMAANERWFQIFLMLCIFMRVTDMVFGNLIRMLIGFTAL
jgi:Zn-dependent protease